ncbi:MAG: anthranilate synthase component I family protein [Sphingobacteriales bacterium]|nr:MAG: anthranilate synthase component I family protein [Sphingobacteriales bacterium]
MKFFQTFEISYGSLPQLKTKMLNWLKQFGIFAYLDNNKYENLLNRYELLVGAGAQHTYSGPEDIAGVFGKEWLFGHINYDYKNQLYKDMKSEHIAWFHNEDCRFFKPGIVIWLAYGSNQLHIESAELQPEIILKQIMDTADEVTGTTSPRPQFQKLFDKDTYLERVRAVKEHILNGDCYELNLCVGAVAEQAAIDPFSCFERLNRVNPAPFACFYRSGAFYALGSSPERFLAKEGWQLLAQPMKGTIRRSADPSEDEQLKANLSADEKERAENVMIADLMRNDLAKSCVTGSIKVPELFKVATFPTLHTMISSVAGKLRDDVPPFTALLNAFPMGSMTGAPKKIVMELIEALEKSKRELYAGCIGYCNPAGDFDFNVVIRTLLYNSTSKRLSYHTGGAITIDSDPEKEWQEVLLKARALEAIF